MEGHFDRNEVCDLLLYTVFEDVEVLLGHLLHGPPVIVEDDHRNGYNRGVELDGGRLLLVGRVAIGLFRGWLSRKFGRILDPRPRRLAEEAPGRHAARANAASGSRLYLTKRQSLIKSTEARAECKPIHRPEIIAQRRTSVAASSERS